MSHPEQPSSVQPSSVQPSSVQPSSVPSGPVPPADDRFAAQRAVLATVGGLPLAEQADVFAAVQGELQAALAEIDGI